MNRHLDEQELAAAVAGLELEAAAREHLAACLACRQAVRATGGVIDARRRELAAGEPDWAAQRGAILARLPAVPAARSPWRRTWWRPALAAAAAVALASAALLLRPQPARPTDGRPPVEQILAEVDATLDGGEIPGFGPLGSLVPGVESSDEVEALLVNGAS